jgi:hypothetical protein
MRSIFSNQDIIVNLNGSGGTQAVAPFSLLSLCTYQAIHNSPSTRDVVFRVSLIAAPEDFLSHSEILLAILAAQSN